jgi:hypothetical protein
MAGYYEGDLCLSNGNSNNGWNDWSWIIGLALVGGLFGGWGNGGFGFGGNRGGVGYDTCCGTPATQADLANGFAQNTLQRGIDDIILGQATMQNFINQGFSGVNASVTNGFANLNTALCSLGYNMAEGFHGVDNAVCTLGYNMQSGFNALGHQISDCCCTQSRNTDSLRFDMAKGFCDVVRAGQDNTRAILDYLSGEKIASLQAENAGLKAQISNDRQSMYITDTILDKLSPCPRPAYLTCDPRLPYGYPYGVGNGCCGASVQ